MRQNVDVEIDTQEREERSKIPGATVIVPKYVDVHASNSQKPLSV